VVLAAVAVVLAVEDQAEAGNTVDIVLKYFELGISLFNNQEYYLAHECFEKAWVKANLENKLFLQGLVQISVGSYHFANGNYINAFKQYTKCINKMEKFSPVYMNINVEKLICWINDLFLEMNLFNNDIVVTKKIKLIYLINSN